MASSGNTWQKKLMNKARLHSLKVHGVKQRWAVDEVVSTKVKDREFNAPMRVGFVVRGFGKKIAAREVRGFAMPSK